MFLKEGFVKFLKMLYWLYDKNLFLYLLNNFDFISLINKLF